MIDIEQTGDFVLALLLGKWNGNGSGEFPTIQSFDYREELEFLPIESRALVRYNQCTWRRTETGEYAPSHQEAGFWRVLPGDEIEIVNAQSGGRVEVSRGKLETVPDGFILRLRSVAVANDARIDKIDREFKLHTDTLEYAMGMSTTSVPTLTRHTHATLSRERQ